MLGPRATFSATAPLARTEKGGALRGSAKVKNNGAVREKMALICTIFGPNKLLILCQLKIPKFKEREGDCGQTIKHTVVQDYRYRYIYKS